MQQPGQGGLEYQFLHWFLLCQDLPVLAMEPAILSLVDLSPKHITFLCEISHPFW
jgi:hypothetical protein